jgi:3-phenylpropionate/trans-cinnamate dioxygenase ferredoxin subunit
LPSVKVAKISEIPPGGKKSVRASKTRVLVVNVDGKFYCIQSVCTHHANPLFTGKLKGKVLWCDNHYASFDVTTGKVADPPVGSEYLKLDPLKIYPAKIDGDDIIVEVQE